MIVSIAAALLAPTGAGAQTYAPKKPRRHFVSISADWLYTQPLHFADHPLEDLLETQVDEVHFETYDYRTRDGSTFIDVLEFSRHSHGAGVTVFPVGISSGAALGIRVSYEGLPTVRVSFDGPGSLDTYSLTNARAYDVAAGVWIADRSAGWGLGSHAFLDGGVGRIRSDLGDGRRYFAEGGGGLTSGPFGVELSVKFAWNMLDDPVDHRFLTVPITLRGTLTF